MFLARNTYWNLAAGHVRDCLFGLQVVARDRPALDLNRGLAEVASRVLQVCGGDYYGATVMRIRNDHLPVVAPGRQRLQYSLDSCCFSLPQWIIDNSKPACSEPLKDEAPQGRIEQVIVVQLPQIRDAYLHARRSKPVQRLAVCRAVRSVQRIGDEVRGVMFSPKCICDVPCRRNEGSCGGVMKVK